MNSVRQDNTYQTKATVYTSMEICRKQLQKLSRVIWELQVVICVEQAVASIKSVLVLFSIHTIVHHHHCVVVAVVVVVVVVVAVALHM